MDVIELQHLNHRAETDRFTPLMIFSSHHEFPAFAANNDISYKAVMGYYRGILEESFVVNHTKNGPLIAQHGLLRGQANVMFLTPQSPVYGGNRDAWLASIDEHGTFTCPTLIFLGLWQKVSAYEALHSDAWTCYPDDNAWYVAKLPDTPTCDVSSQ